MKEKSFHKKYNQENSVLPLGTLPETAFDMVNRYGTYNIQSTADTDNQYPAIAQGFNSKMEHRDGENRHHGGDWETAESQKQNLKKQK